jgi:hypothetical protein
MHALWREDFLAAVTGIQACLKEVDPRFRVYPCGSFCRGALNQVSIDVVVSMVSEGGVMAAAGGGNSAQKLKPTASSREECSLDRVVSILQQKGVITCSGGDRGSKDAKSGNIYEDENPDHAESDVDERHSSLPLGAECSPVSELSAAVGDGEGRTQTHAQDRPMRTGSTHFVRLSHQRCVTILTVGKVAVVLDLKVHCCIDYALPITLTLLFCV